MVYRVGNQPRLVDLWVNFRASQALENKSIVSDVIISVIQYANSGLIRLKMEAESI